MAKIHEELEILTKRLEEGEDLKKEGERLIYRIYTLGVDRYLPADEANEMQAKVRKALRRNQLVRSGHKLL